MKTRPAYVRACATRALDLRSTRSARALPARSSEDITLVLWPSEAQTLVFRPMQGMSMRAGLLGALARRLRQLVAVR